jgi:hypothetical protein
LRLVLPAFTAKNKPRLGEARPARMGVFSAQRK